MNDSGDKIRVMIVDDVAETRKQLRRLLSFDPDIQVVAMAGSGEEAIEIVIEARPDVITMDVNLPGIDGIATTGKILEIMPAVQIIMLSVQEESGYMRKAMMAGARDYLAKPPSAVDLLDAITRAYKMRQKMDSDPLQAAIEIARYREKQRQALLFLENIAIFERWNEYVRSSVTGYMLDLLEQRILGIPHDLKGPLNTALNSLDLLFSLLSDVDEVNLGHTITNLIVLHCKKNIQYALLLIEQLVSVVTHVDIEARREISLNDVLLSVLDLIKYQFHTTFPIKVYTQMDHIFRINERDLEQIVFSLLVNAVEAVDASDGMEITIQLSKSPILQVFSKGSSLDDTVKGLIGTLSYTTKDNHTGLGLFVCKRKIEQLSGEFSLNEDSEGVRARVWLPYSFSEREINYRFEDILEDLDKRRELLDSKEREVAIFELEELLRKFVNNLTALIEEVVKIMLWLVNTFPELPVRVLHSIQRNCSYAMSIAHSILAPSQPVEFEPLNLRDALLEVLWLFDTDDANLKTSQSTFQVSDDIWIKADRTQFQRVFFNLTRNALEAMRESQKLDLSIAAKTQHGFAVISFADKGKGIPREQQSRVFQAGFSTKSRGRGLGLFTTRRIIEEHHNGKIEFESEEGKGTCFTIYWPLSSRSFDSIKSPDPAKTINMHTQTAGYDVSKMRSTEDLPRMKAKKSGAKLLIVDDDRDWIDVATRRLKSVVELIDTARTATKAIKLIEQNEYSCILLDWCMPGISGKGVLEAIQGMEPWPYIIVFSAHADSSEKAVAFNLGAKMSEPKPKPKEWNRLKRILEDVIIRNK